MAQHTVTLNVAQETALTDVVTRENTARGTSITNDDFVQRTALEALANRLDERRERERINLHRLWPNLTTAQRAQILGIVPEAVE